MMNILNILIDAINHVTNIKSRGVLMANDFDYLDVTKEVIDMQRKFFLVNVIFLMKKKECQ